MLNTLETNYKKRMAIIGLLCAGIGMMLDAGLGQRALIVFGFGLTTLTIADWLTQRSMGG